MKKLLLALPFSAMFVSAIGIVATWPGTHMVWIGGVAGSYIACALVVPLVSKKSLKIGYTAAVLPLVLLLLLVATVLLINDPRWTSQK